MADLQPKQNFEALPEARLWKWGILKAMFNAINLQGQVYMVRSNRYALAKERLKYEAAIITLYTALKVKIKSPTEKAKFRELEDYIKVAWDGGNVNKNLSMTYLNDCLDLMTKKVENIGITKVEKLVVEPEFAVLEE